MGRMSELAAELSEQEQYEPSREEMAAAAAHHSLVDVCESMAKAPLDVVDIKILAKAIKVLLMILEGKINEDYK